jgi:hypothetical protein
MQNDRAKKVEINSWVAEENDFCILICGFDFLSFSFNLS